MKNSGIPQIQVKMDLVLLVGMIYVLHGTTSKIIYETTSSSDIYRNVAYRCGKCICTKDGYDILSVNCSYRNFIDIPTNLPVNASILNMKGNYLSVVKTDSFKYMPTLVSLDLSLNSIKKIEDGAFSGLHLLTTLSLEGNRLELSPDTYKFNAFNGLKKLRVLKINNNVVSDSSSYPDIAFRTLEALQTLALDGLPYTNFGVGFQSLKNLKTLYMSGYIGSCSIVNITQHTFASLRFIEYLNLTNCNIQNVEKGGLRHMDYIRVLDTSNNDNMGLDNMANLIYGISKSIKEIHANSLYPLLSLGTMLTRQHAASLLNSSLQELHLDANRIQLMEIGVVSSLPKTLKYVSLKANIILYGPYCLELITMTGLKTLDMSYLYHSLPQPGRRKRGSKLRRSYKRAFDENQKKNVLKFKSMDSSNKRDQKALRLFPNPIPPNLTTLIYHQSKLRYYIPELSFGRSILENLDLSENTLYEWRGPIHANGSEHLQYLNLAGNSCDNVSDVFFDALPGLRTLIIQNNLLGLNLKRDINGKIFKKLKNLQTLDLSKNRLESLPGAIFKGLYNLMNLNVSHNFLVSWEPEMGHMKNISNLDFSYNQIKWFSKNTMETLDKRSLETNITVNLSRNTIECSCYSIDFLKWLLNSDVHVILKIDDYCIFQNQTRSNITRLTDVVIELQKECKSYVLVIVLMSVSIAFVMAIIVGAIVYRNRWKLRYMYHMTRLKVRGYSVLKNENDAAKNYIYDAFVSYAEEDRDFVLDDIIERLEKRNNLKLCIHQRDFRIGEPIGSNIMQAINNSRKIIVLMSRDFINSYWCRYELQLANIESKENDRNFICMILKETIPTKDLPLEIIAYLQSNSYIEYPKEGVCGDIEMFWERVQTALQEV